MGEATARPGTAESELLRKLMGSGLQGSAKFGDRGTVAEIMARNGGTMPEGSILHGGLVSES